MMRIIICAVLLVGCLMASNDSVYIAYHKNNNDTPVAIFKFMPDTTNPLFRNFTIQKTPKQAIIDSLVKRDTTVQ